MSTTLFHYDNLLAKHYSWLFGDFDKKVETTVSFFNENKIFPKLSKIAIDLGAGPGFQSIALAKQGFEVIAIDFCKQLLDELNDKKGNLHIKTIRANLLNFEQNIDKKADLIVCMGDTLTHLESLNDVELVMQKSCEKLEKSGQLIFEFRDFTYQLEETERFIPVKSDSNTIFTCFLEYESEYVKVHDLLYVKQNDKWEFKISYYKKLIISPDWVKTKLEQYNFRIQSFTNNKGMVSVIADKRK